jgi:hypothetical protein
MPEETRDPILEHEERAWLILLEILELLPWKDKRQWHEIKRDAAALGRFRDFACYYKTCCDLHKDHAGWVGEDAEPKKVMGGIEKIITNLDSIKPEIGKISEICDLYGIEGDRDTDNWGESTIFADGLNHIEYLDEITEYWSKVLEIAEHKLPNEPKAGARFNYMPDDSLYHELLQLIRALLPLLKTSNKLTQRIGKGICFWGKGNSANDIRNMMQTAAGTGRNWWDGWMDHVHRAAE